ncbi:hypothetical protein BDY19DRAFT_1065192 [Irpex rosettiformis]|uniref:Uncharacterized protein n=1 Tax=Irpex rosettiformis TaxID=378272 RepID=A0ACB8UE55_9APHY|nr:hypothetical protein BDY19DRAFT_1065192 [Irpex rosettiformis]
MATVTQSYPRTGGYSDIASAANRDDAGSSIASLSHLRPNILHRDTDQILSYYQSEFAGQSHDSDDEQRAGLSRRSSSISRSSSHYSSESTHDKQPVQKVQDLPPQSSAASATVGHVRRPSVPSQESVDRRRLAIVELDSSLPPSVGRKGTSGSDYTGVSTHSSLSYRRGVHVNGLALVAPPDASPATYTDLTPPPTAPPFAGNRGLDIAPPSSAAQTRSASEAIGGHSHLHRKTSRDVGIVGVGRVIPAISEAGEHSSPRLNRLTAPSALHTPIFQTPPKSRPPSPTALTPDLAGNGTSTINSPIHPRLWDHSDPGREHSTTPAIGEGKDIQQPVVGPVIVGFQSGKVVRREPMHPMDINNASVTTNGSSFKHYEHHSTAGPLPPPPRTIFDLAAVSSPVSSAPPPRPPRMRTPMPLPQVSTPSSAPAKRDLEALKESLQLPQSVSSALASRSPSRPVLERAGTDISTESSVSDSTKSSAISDSAVDTKRSQSIHRREGAFPPSNQTTAKSTPEGSPVVKDDSQDHGTSTSGGSVQIVHPRSPSPESVYEDTEDYERRSAIELKRDLSWVSLKDTSIASSPNGQAPQHLPGSRSRSCSRSPVPQPPPKSRPAPPIEGMRSRGSSHSGSTNPLKATLNNLKRFSALPRTPSSLSMKSFSRSDSTHRSPSTPSPVLATTPRNIRARVIDPWPDAMTFRDVSALTSPVERASAYAQKIQQLSMCDTGLSEWLQAMQTKGPGPRPIRTALQLDIGLSHPSTRASAAQQPRHVSQNSVSSEATFPLRRDAYTATDLMMRADEDLNLGKPPPISLPYPSLAVKSPPSRASTSVPPTPRSYQVPLSTGPSRSGGGFFSTIGRKGSLKKADSPSVPSRVLTKRSQSRPTQPLIISAPTIPGGERAPPGKLQRSHTMSITSVKPVEQPPVSITRSDTRASISSRRPSFFHRSAAAQPIPPTDEEFERQVDKLADLLPHADRTVLAGYLRRAGQDILAIGQYLEDEKKGTIRYD